MSPNPNLRAISIFRHAFLFAVAIACGILLVSGCDEELDSAGDHVGVPDFLGEIDASIYRTNASEELLLKLTRRLDRFRSRLTEREGDLSELFFTHVEYAGPVEWDADAFLQLCSTDSQSSLASIVDWPSDHRSAKVRSDEVWRSLQDLNFSDLSFGILRGSFEDDRLDVFHMTLSIEGHLEGDKISGGFTSQQKLVWKKEQNQLWKVAHWAQEKFSIVSSHRKMFEDITDATINPKSTVEKIQHDQVAAWLQLQAQNKPHPLSEDLDFQFFHDWRSSAQFPSVSVVDFDGDKWEDLFFTSGFGETFLLRNVLGKHFENVTQSSGLYLPNSYANCSLFADFDNDGDPDVLIGRTTQPSLFFRNENGKFIASPDVNKNLIDCRFISSGSVADVNGDGLLDVYLSTYCVHGKPQQDWIQRVVPPQQQVRFANILQEDRDNTLDRPGPPNILLLNRGGILEPAATDESLQQWRNSYQSVWIDADLDGDPDLYLCNDFSPDVLLRNETEKGSFQVRFIDATSDFFPQPLMGFGMGASVGDYNSDGLLDLYVSNMYSKAGHRIFNKIGGSVDPNLKVAAQGNFLYRNTGNKFVQVAGHKNGQHVSKVGWSFGGQMADFNNDCRLDIYVPSGLFTAPEKIKAHQDL